MSNVKTPTPRPSIEDVPMNCSFAFWYEQEPGKEHLITEHVVAILPVECKPCALWYRAFADDPRPCPSCKAPGPPPQRPHPMDGGKVER